MRVLLADKQSKVRFALAALLEQQAHITIVGEVQDSAGLLDQVKHYRPDLVLLDWSLPGRDAVDVLVHLHKTHPDLSIIVMSGRPEMSQLAIAAGADAFVSKAEPPDRLLAAVNQCQQKTLKLDLQKNPMKVETND